MREVLVTGGAGFIGSNFVRHALHQHADWRVTTLDKLTYAGRRENLHDVMDHPRHLFVHGDICDAVSPRLSSSNRTSSSISPPRRTSIARSWPPGCSSGPTSKGRSSCSRRPGVPKPARAIRADFDRRSLRQRRERREQGDRRTASGEPIFREQVRRRPAGLQLFRYLQRACGRHAGVRTITARISSRRKLFLSSSPIFSTTFRCHSTATAATCATGCTCSITAARSTA